MQTLKPNVKERIESAALELFCKEGYEKTSMRKIAHEARMTVGNLYHYYANKDALFDALVRDTTQILIDYANEVNEIKMKDAHANKSEMERVIDIIVNTLFPQRKRILLLYLGSKGTPYEGAYEKEYERLKAQFYEVFKVREEFDEARSSLLAAINARYYTDAIIRALQKVETPEAFRYILRDVIYFQRYGINGYVTHTVD